MVVFFSKTTVLAQESPSEAQMAEARQLFVQGLELSDRGKWAEAAEHFRRVKAVKDAPPVAYNLALNLAELDQLGEASELLDGVIAAPDATRTLKRDATRLRAAVQKRAARLTFKLTGKSDDIFLLLDGRELKDPSKVQHVRPGEHTVTIEREEREILNKKIEAIKGANTEVRLTILPPSAINKVPDLSVPAEVPTLEEKSAQTKEPTQAETAKTPLHKDWRLWAGVAAAVVVIIAVIAVVVGTQRSAFDGNFEPGQLMFGSGS